MPPCPPDKNIPGLNKYNGQAKTRVQSRPAPPPPPPAYPMVAPLPLDLVEFNLPVCVLIWACKDFSLGNTRLQMLHRILLAIFVPSMIRLVMLSALGRPLLSLSCSFSGDPHELAGLRSILCAPAPQFHGYIMISFSGGLVGVESSFPRSLGSRFGDANMLFPDIFLS